MSNRVGHVAIIMDGNNRWAQINNLTTQEGHKAGAENAFRIIKKAIEKRIVQLSLYVFSSENLQRPKDEVDNIIGLINHYIISEFDAIYTEGVRLRFVGNLTLLDDKTLDNLKNVEEKSSSNSMILVNIMLCYGSRSEIVSACSKIISKGIKAEELSEDIFASNLYQDIPDVDLLIRTGDKVRISNFLLWQSAYAELYFSKKMWPEFTEDDFTEAIEDYFRRNRTFGKR